MSVQIVTQAIGVHWLVCVDRHRIADIWKDPGKYGRHRLTDYEGKLVGTRRRLDDITRLARKVFGEDLPA